MAKTRPVVDSSTIFATKGAGGAVAESRPKKPISEEKLVDLNFKVPDSFRRRFKIRAAEEGITGVEMLRRMFDAS
ncbi:hypothetical protein BBC27_09725 [Acidithiobacillus ferrivorans]|uniref:Uncharacterized protein n=1 Tax=Acidithiobacillus ferrivorans TaxID=160808 RepID=A0A1B9BZH2_9PROT|nr:hypothetical protein [Acidithiobacillus ferrivorans]OCB03116.1 hypothetical protein BBC27_09725 [Acidithiobacillus ferrivorans]